MSKRSRYFQAFTGMALAFLVGLGAMAAQDMNHDGKVVPAVPTAQSAPAGHAAMGMGSMAAMGQNQPFAPGLPGWIKQLPADKQETARKIWLADGRAIVGYKEMLVAKRHELNALQALPGADDKALQALVKEISSYEEKLLTAEIGFRRKLEKEGIPTWGRFEHGMHQMMMDQEGGMMGKMGGGMGMMGMMHGQDMNMGKQAPVDKVQETKPAQ